MTWHKISISAQQASENHHGKIQDQYTQILINSKNFKGMALLSSGWSDSDTFNHCCPK